MIAAVPQAICPTTVPTCTNPVENTCADRAYVAPLSSQTLKAEEVVDNPRESKVTIGAVDESNVFPTGAVLLWRIEGAPEGSRMTIHPALHTVPHVVELELPIGQTDTATD